MIRTRIQAHYLERRLPGGPRLHLASVLVDLGTSSRSNLSVEGQIIALVLDWHRQGIVWRLNVTHGADVAGERDTSDGPAR